MGSSTFLEGAQMMEIQTRLTRWTPELASWSPRLKVPSYHHTSSLEMWSTQPDVNLGKNGGRVAVASVREYVYVCNKDTGVILKFELNKGVVKAVDSGWDLRSPVGENL